MANRSRYSLALSFILGLGLIVACGDSTSPENDQVSVNNSSENSAQVPAHIPSTMKACFTCHAEIVESFSNHGMSQSLGPAGDVPAGSVTNPYSGTEYVLQADGSRTVLTGTFENGAQRQQEIVGRLGAGIFDISWVGAEIDKGSGNSLDRLFFAPVETVTGHGLELSPFELREGSIGMSLSLTQGCLTCHTDDQLSDLPRASLDQNGASIHPGHSLGSDAFDKLNALSCTSCHGATNDHIDLMSGLLGGENQKDVQDIGALAPNRQVDVCARCHLQGDIRFEFGKDRPSSEHPLAGQIPVTVPAKSNPDFRFVAQVDRLTESACYIESASITCTTCHDPHTGVQAQGVQSFENTCIGCHQDLSKTHMGAKTVESVTGKSSRSENGCIDCHLSKSQPFDLPHIQTTDHHIRKVIPKSKTLPHRSFTDSSGTIKIYNEEEIAEYLSKPGGSLWADGIKAMSLTSMGRLDEAIAFFDKYPDPGTPASRSVTAPEGLVPLKSQVDFHILRSQVYREKGNLPKAFAAITDAIALDGNRAQPREDRALLYMLMGDMRKAFLEADSVLSIQPNSEKAWNLRGAIALRQGFPEVAIESFTRSTEIWPTDPNPWYQLANLYESRGMKASSEEAFQRYYDLVPEDASAEGGAQEE